MSNFLQSIYIGILNPIYIITGLINDRIRDIIIFVIFLLIFLYYKCATSSILCIFVTPYLPTLFERHLFGCAMLSILILISVNRPLQHVEWKRVIIIPQILLGLGIIIIGFIHPIGAGYQTFGFMLLLLFPCFYLVWNNRRDYDHLFKIIIYAMLIANMMLFLITYYYAFQGQLTMQGPRCAGIMGNSNSFSMVGMEMVLGALYLLVTKRVDWIPFMLICCCTGVGIGIVLIGQMRIAVLVLLFGLLASVIFYLKYRGIRNMRGKTMIVRLLIGLSIVVTMIILTYGMMQINNNVFEENNKATQVETGQTADKQKSSNIVDRFKIGGKDSNGFSSGRLVIWKNYAEELNLIGNNFDEYDMEKMTGGQPYPFAHNIFLELGYRCGIPIALLSLFMMFVTGIIALRYLFLPRGKDLFLLFPIISVIAYALEALLDCAVLPFFQAEVLCYYISMIVFIDRRC